METNNRAQLEDVGQNADLYIANQEANTQPFGLLFVARNRHFTLAPGIVPFQ